MTHLINFRDRGGIKANDKSVKTGLLLRGGPLAHLSHEDTAWIKETLQLERILDLRTDSEIEKLPNDDLGIVVEHINITGSKYSSSADPSEFLKTLDPNDVHQNMVNLYTNTPLSEYSQKRFIEFFDALVSSSGPVYFHCTAGKDRTGMSATLILFVLGVSKEDIIKDYLQSNNNIDQILKSVMLSYKNVNASEVQSISGTQSLALQKLLGVEKDYIHSFFNSIDSKYGSMEIYIRDVLNLDEVKQELLKSKFID